MRAVVAWLVAVVVLFTSVDPKAADRPWYEVRSDHFTVATDFNEKTARTLAWQFEQIRSAIRVICPWARADIDRPILVFAARDENTMKALLPKYWEQRGADRPGSVSAGGADRYYIAVRGDEYAENAQFVNPYRDAYWQYTILTINASLRRELPIWFDRGFAHVLSNTNVRDETLEVGRVIPSLLQTLRSGSERMHVQELLTVDRRSPWATLGTQQFFMYDAESWAFVHFLLFADNGTRRARVDQLIAMIASGVPQQAAVKEVFPDVDVLERDFFQYLNRSVFQFGSIKADASQKREAYPARQWSPAEALGKQAFLHVAMDRPADARALVAAARKIDAAQVDTFEVEGLLADEDKNAESARAAYQKAVELGSKHYYAQYRFATLARPGADQAMTARVLESLERAAGLNYNFAPAFQQLAALQMQLGKTEPALASLQHVVELLPTQLPARLNLARALGQAGKKEDALRQAQQALALATTDADKRIAQQAVDQYSR